MDSLVQMVVDDVGTPDEYDVELAVRSVRGHRPTRQERCVNCGWPFPCVTRRWAVGLLAAAGWRPEAVATLSP